MMDLLGSDSDSDCAGPAVALNTENKYAARYDEWRGKEQLQKLKDKYGEDYEEEESDSDDEDEDAEELTEDVEKDFFTTLASLKKKDPKIYDGKTEFFKESKSQKTSSGSVKGGKMTIGDIERKVMLEKGGEFEEIEDNNIKYGKDYSYNEEMKSIKDSFKNALNDNEVDDELLSKRSKSEQETKDEADSYKKWLAGQQSKVEDPEIEAKMEGLRDFWNKDDLDDGEKFLKDYLLNKRFLENEQDNYVPSYDEIVHDSDEDLSEDEKNVKKQEEFEQKFNFRFEEPDEDFIKRYPRTIKDTLRKDEDKRKKKRKDVEERKKQEKEIKKEELKMLKNMKKKEILEKLEKLKKITGNDDMELDEEDIEGDFDPEKYDKKMKEIFRNYDDDTADGEDQEKPTFSDIDEEEYDEDDVEDWDNWTGVAGEENEAELNCEDEGFNMDCDFQQEMIESTKGRKKGRRKSKFAEAIENNTDKPVFDPEDKTFTEYVDEYYKLDCEDLIGDLPCRFKYRTVQQNDFGLSVEEVLAAPDKELNAWASLRKTCQYRSEEDERKDFHVFRNKAKDQKLKKKIMPTLFDEAGAATANTAEEVTVVATGTKKRKRTKKKKKAVAATAVVPDKEPDNKKIKLDRENVESSQTEKDEGIKKKKKKKKKALLKNSAIQVEKIAGFFEKNKHSSEKPTNKKTEDLLQFSNERLKAYGVNPNQFKRKLKKEKYRNLAEQK